MTKSEITKLDKKWKEKIFDNAGFRCEIDGTSYDFCQLHPHHYYTRKNRATRWYIPNGICLSASRHTLGIWSAHKSPEWFRSQMLERRGDKWLKDLIKQANKTFKGTYETVLEYLEGRTKNYVL